MAENTSNVTALDSEDIRAAQNAIAAYKSSCEAAFTKLKGQIDTITNNADSFLGDASTGYLEFFNKLAPGLSTNLYGEGDGTSSVVSYLNSILKMVEDALIGQVDPELGRMNTNAGDGGAAPAASTPTAQ